MSVSFLGSQMAECGSIASSRPALVTSGTGHAKGAYAQLIAATTIPTAWALVSIGRFGGSVDFLVDIAVGAGGAEQVVVANIPVSQNVATSPTATTFLLPLFIPAGSRLAARSQHSAGAFTLDVQVTLFAPMLGGERGLGQVETCGANTGTSLGTTIPGHTTTAHTKGTWTELIAATTIPYRWACLGITHTNAAAANTWWTIDIGVGAGGTEVVVVPDLIVHAGSVIDAIPHGGKSFPFAIPAGTRIAARCQCSVTTASERDLELVLLGVG